MKSLASILLCTFLLSSCANISGSGSVHAGSGGDVNVGGSIGVQFP